VSFFLSKPSVHVASEREDVSFFGHQKGSVTSTFGVDNEVVRYRLDLAWFILIDVVSCSQLTILVEAKRMGIAIRGDTTSMHSAARYELHGLAVERTFHLLRRADTFIIAMPQLSVST
jgi:hypothetical protein